MSRAYTIGQLAAEAGVGVETVRYYQRRNLMPEPARPLGAARRYSEADVERLRFIKRAQVMGFTLAEIDDLLLLRARRSCRATRDLATAKLKVVDVRLRELRQLREELTHLLAKCDLNMDDTSCPIMECLDSHVRS